MQGNTTRDRIQTGYKLVIRGSDARDDTSVLGTTDNPSDE
jgi:hypothetical protein